MIDKFRRLMKNENIRQAVCFLFVGVLNTIVGYGTYFIGIKCGLHFMVASAIGQTIGTVHSYIWNKFLTFQSKEKSLSEIFRFVMVYVVQYLVNVNLIALFVKKAGLSDELAGLFATIICTAVSFFGHKFFSFRKTQQSVADTDESNE